MSQELADAYSAILKSLLGDSESQWKANEELVNHVTGLIPDNDGFYQIECTQGAFRFEVWHTLSNIRIHTESIYEVILREDLPAFLEILVNGGLWRDITFRYDDDNLIIEAKRVSWHEVITIHQSALSPFIKAVGVVINS